VVDARRLRSVGVDRRSGTVTVGAGANWGDVDPATQRFGQAVPGLPLSGIGVAGSTLGGGYGHLRRAYGLACDNLLSADLVTADGRSEIASGDRNSELLWGLRGGGGNFGVLTSLTFQLRPLPGPVMCGALIFPAERAAELLRFYREFTAALRDDVSTRFVLIGERHSSVVSSAVGKPRPGPVVAISVACVGHPAEAAALVRPLRTAAPVLRDLLAVRPYTVLQAGSGPTYPHGVPALVGSHFLGGLDDGVIAAICESFEAMPADSCDLHVDHMGGKVGRVAQMSTAAPNRGAPYLVSTMARWPTGVEGAAHRRWHEDTEARLDKHAVGGPHVGMTSARVSTEQVYGPERHLRLAALKRRYDPDNLFTGNQNVLPLP
jgi:FAD/FMN-containing dehydrogenase